MGLLAPSTMCPLAALLPMATCRRLGAEPEEPLEPVELAVLEAEVPVLPLEPALAELDALVLPPIGTTVKDTLFCARVLSPWYPPAESSSVA